MLKSGNRPLSLSVKPHIFRNHIPQPKNVQEMMHKSVWKCWFYFYIFCHSTQCKAFCDCVWNIKYNQKFEVEATLSHGYIDLYNLKAGETIIFLIECYICMLSCWPYNRNRNADVKMTHNLTQICCSIHIFFSYSHLLIWAILLFCSSFWHSFVPFF